MTIALWIIWGLTLVLWIITPFIPTLLDKWYDRMLRKDLEKIEGDGYLEEGNQG